MESRRSRDWIPSEAQRDLTETTPAPRSHWLRELVIVLAFYYTYELIRRFAHFGKVRPRAFRNQLYLIDLERFLHIYSESAVQKAFLGARWFIKVMNVYYGTLHFIITAGLLIWVYLRRHEHYRQYRNLLGMTTALAIDRLLRVPTRPAAHVPVPRLLRRHPRHHRRPVVVPLERGEGHRQPVRGDAEPALRLGAVVRHPVVVVRPASCSSVAQRASTRP